MKREGHPLLKARDAACRCGKQDACSSLRANLRSGICPAKNKYKLRVELNFSSPDPWHTWHADCHSLQTTQYCDPQPAQTHSLMSSTASSVSLTERTKNLSSKLSSLPMISLSHSPPRMSASPLSRVCIRKAAGPDGISHHVLRVCTEQLAVVFTDNFNLALSQAAVPPIFKSATPVPLP